MDKIDNTNYETIRSKIKSGDALAWTHKGWKTWYDFQIQMVRAFSQSEYCHVGVAWVIGKRVFILESVGTGIRIYPLSLELPFYWIPIKKYWTKDIEEFALSKMGAKYSKWEGIQALFGKLKNGDDNEWECAEFALALLSRGNVISNDVKAVPTNVVKALQSEGYPTYLIEH